MSKYTHKKIVMGEWPAGFYKCIENVKDGEVIMRCEETGYWEGWRRIGRCGFQITHSIEGCKVTVVYVISGPRPWMMKEDTDYFVREENVYYESVSRALELAVSKLEINSS
jgi:hypothetical protein